MNNFALVRNLFAIVVMLVVMPAQVNARELPNFVALVESNSAAVVNISTTQKLSTTSQLPHGFSVPDLPEGSPFGDLFRHFFGEGGGPHGDDHPSPKFDSKSLGSGFIISEQGYVLTNHHVVKDATEIMVRLSDRRELKAEVIGSDERSDIALLKIDAKNLPVVSIGNPQNLKVGEWVLAIGSPFGFDHSATAGIVSAKGRSLPSENYVPFIQTDVAINPGNSGGPLFNLDGQVVGVNAQIYSRTGGFMGLSFAIPIDVAMEVVEQLKETGHVSRGWLGVMIQNVTQELAESFGMDKPSGALVAKVLPDSPAAKAGIETGDVIVEYAGREVTTSSKLPPMVGRTKVGVTEELRVIRNGKSKQIKVTIGELPAEDATLSANGKHGEMTNKRIGVVVSELNAEQRKNMEVEEHGVLVQSVTEGPASDAGIRKGDVILVINNVSIENLQQFKSVVDELPADKSVPVLVQRRGGPTFLALKTPK